jgi:anti-sigma factor RsiW
MSAHLAACPRCEETALVFGRVATMRKPPEPSDAAVERALAVFRHPHPGAVNEAQPRKLRPRVLYDSLLAGVPVGTRRAGRESRRQLFEAGAYFLDLDLAVQTGSAGPAQLVLVGQLLDRAEPARAVPGFLVRLEGREGPMAQTESNALGEFELLGDARAAVRLAIPLGDVEIELDLPKPPTRSEPGAGEPER